MPELTIEQFLKQHHLKMERVEDYQKAFIHRSYLQVDKSSDKNELQGRQGWSHNINSAFTERTYGQRAGQQGVGCGGISGS